MRIRRITELSLLTAASLIIFIIEMQLPDLIPIPGVKVGLANIFTVYALYRFKPSEVVLMLCSRILLGGIFSGNISALIYSASGAIFCLTGMILLRKFLPLDYVWLCSIFGAILHNTGQMTAAIIVTKTFSVAAYYPLLIISGSIAGFFTGLCAKFVLKRIRQIEGRDKNESIGNDET